MQGKHFRCRGWILSPSSVLILLVLPLCDLPYANGSCEFPASWAGEWYKHTKQSMMVNSTMLGERTCVERSKDSYVVYENNCYHCMIINDRHENVIQYREGYCFQDYTTLEDMCSNINSDDTLNSMFRVNSQPIPCPFSGPSFTFTYDKGKGECATHISLAERCTDESKLLLKYQACPNVESTESNTEELQCLALWNDGRNKYLVGTLKGMTAVGSDKTYRCFLYEEKPHHQGKVVYLIAQSGDTTCNDLTTVSQGSITIKLTKVDKEHNRCKYPAWITEHHDWHSLDGTKVYHFTNKNATLKVKVQEAEGDSYHEEKIVCHNLEKSYPNDNTQGYKVKLVAHVTSGCDIGYVCMIFHKRDHHVIELQESDQKAIMPDEACSLSDPSTMPYVTLISSTLRQRKCPNPGRYVIPGRSFAPFHMPARRQRRGEKRLTRTPKRTSWQDDMQDQTDQGTILAAGEEAVHEEDGRREEECKSAEVQIGCSSVEQNELIIGKSCDRDQSVYYCHGSWEEKGTWYTIVSQRTAQLTVGLGQAFCFSMRFGSIAERTAGRSDRSKAVGLLDQQQLWLSRPERVCRREPTVDEWAYRLTSQGVCGDVTKAASSLAALFSLSRILFALIVGTCAAHKFLLR